MIRPKPSCVFQRTFQAVCAVSLLGKVWMISLSGLAGCFGSLTDSAPEPTTIARPKHAPRPKKVMKRRDDMNCSLWQKPGFFEKPGFFGSSLPDHGPITPAHSPVP